MIDGLFKVIKDRYVLQLSTLNLLDENSKNGLL